MYRLLGHGAGKFCKKLIFVRGGVVTLVLTVIIISKIFLLIRTHMLCTNYYIFAILTYL